MSFVTFDSSSYQLAANFNLLALGSTPSGYLANYLRNLIINHL